MALTLFRLHTNACKEYYKRTDRTGKDCTCMIHAEGNLNGSFVRKSTHTRYWSKAEKLVAQAERLGRWVEAQIVADDEAENFSPRIGDAVKSYLSRLKSKSGRNLLDPSVSKHRTTVERLASFALAEKLQYISEIDYDVLDQYQRDWDKWDIAPQTAANYIVRLRKMGKFFVRKGWWPKNYAADLEYPEDYEHTEREPYTDSEMEAILEAARTIELDAQSETTNWEIETIILLMRSSGMAIIDAATLDDSEIVGDQLVYYRHKTRRNKNRVKIVFPLPADVLDRLKQIKKSGLYQGKYYFCRGSAENATDVWHKRLAMVFEAAKIKNAGAHRFRHTFATYWLSQKIRFPNGGWGYTPVAVVARWLGHASEATTRRYYSHWIKQREDEASEIARQHYENLSSAAGTTGREDAAVPIPE